MAREHKQLGDESLQEIWQGQRKRLVVEVPAGQAPAPEDAAVGAPPPSWVEMLRVKVHLQEILTLALSKGLGFGVWFDWGEEVLWLEIVTPDHGKNLFEVRTPDGLTSHRPTIDALFAAADEDDQDLDNLPF